VLERHDEPALREVRQQVVLRGHLELGIASDVEDERLLGPLVDGRAGIRLSQEVQSLRLLPLGVR
jgi:hypothetical protein